jgi:hypothetical protein
LQYTDGSSIVVTSPSFFVITTSPVGNTIVFTPNEGVSSSKTIPLSSRIVGLLAGFGSLYLRTPHSDLIATPVFEETAEPGSDGWWHA